jgi:hypothetical protein
MNSIKFPANVQSVFNRYQASPDKSLGPKAEYESIPGADSHHLAMTTMEEASYIKQVDEKEGYDSSMNQENVVTFSPKMIEGWNQMRSGVTELSAEFAEDGQSMMRREVVDGTEVISHTAVGDNRVEVFQAFIADGQTQVYAQSLGPGGSGGQYLSL